MVYGISESSISTSRAVTVVFHKGLSLGPCYL